MNRYLFITYRMCSLRKVWTSINLYILTFLLLAILKRVLLDYGDKIKDEEKAKIKIIIYRAEDVLSYYCVDNLRYGPGDLGYDCEYFVFIFF